MATSYRTRIKSKSNHARRLNPLLATCNELWAARTLGMQHNSTRDGPDLYDETKIGEVKFHLLNGGKSNYIKWTGQRRQKNYALDGREGYWVLGTYHLRKEVSDLVVGLDNLEDLIYDREAFIVPLDWAKRYRSNKVSGKTEQSAWSYHMFYPKFRHLPQTVSSKVVLGGIVHFTLGTDASTFSL